MVTPDGEETEHYLIVRGIDSDEFQRADAKARSAMLEQMRRNKEKGIATTDGNLEDHKLTIVSSLIAEWSFNEPCTEPNIRKFLTEAPQIREEVDRFAVDRRRFFKKPSQG